jgi:hypothetical protein
MSPMSPLSGRLDHVSERVGVVEREALERARRRRVGMNAEHHRLLVEVAELEWLGVAQQTGDRRVERLVGEVFRVDPGEARRLVEEARDLVGRRSLLGEPLPPRYPHTAAALEAGAVTAGHLPVVRRTMARLEQVAGLAPATLVEAERFLAEKATEQPPCGLVKVAARLLAQLDPDGQAPDPPGERDDEVHVVRRRDGSLDLRARFLDPAGAAVIDDGLEVMATPAGPDDQRALANRRAEGLKELFAAAHGPAGLITDTRRADGEDDGQEALIPSPRTSAEDRGAALGAGRAVLTLTIDHRWLRDALGHAVLDSGVPVDAASVRRWARDAEVIPVLLGSGSQPLDIGRMTRTVPDAIRRALNLRDGGCAFPGCTRRPRRCHAHHVAMPLS